MGMNVEATLAYGYDLGAIEDFKAAQRSEYGSPNLPWFNEDTEDDDQVSDVPDAGTKTLLASVGFTEEWSRDVPGFYDRQRAARERLGVDFDYSGSHDYPGFILYAKGSEQSVDWAEALALDPAEIAASRPDWDAKLTAALAVLGITPTQDGPRWLVFPFYG